MSFTLISSDKEKIVLNNTFKKLLAGISVYFGGMEDLDFENTKEILVPHTNFEQLQLLKIFLEHIKLEEEIIQDFLLEKLKNFKPNSYFINVDLTLKNLFESFPLLKSFYYSILVDEKTIEAYFRMSDFISIELLEKLIYLKIVSLYKNDITCDEDTRQRLLIKYLPKIEEYVKELSIDELNSILSM